MAPVVLALGAYLFTLMKGKATGDKLEYFPDNIEVIHGKLVYKMDILNPTSNKLKIDSFIGGIYANDKKIGSIEKNTSFTLSKKGRTTVSFPVQPVGAGAIEIIKQAVTGNIKNTKFKVAGVAHALGIDKPISQDISFGKK